MRASLVREVNTLTGDLLSGDTPVSVDGCQETLGKAAKEKKERGKKQEVSAQLGVIYHIHFELPTDIYIYHKNVWMTHITRPGDEGTERKRSTKLHAQ